MEREHVEYTPLPRNAENVFELDGEAFVPIRRKGRVTVVRVPPVPYRDGLAIATLQAEIKQHLQRMDPADGRAQLAKLAALYPQLEQAVKRCIRPSGWFAHLRRWLGLWHPLRGATLEEVASLAGFLLRRQTRPRIG
jgi:hypothetical protein